MFHSRLIKSISPIASLFLISIVLNSSVWAQSYIYSTGVPSFTTAVPAELGFVNASNGNLHLEIPLESLQERGGRSSSSFLSYDSRIWQIVGSSWQPTNVSNSIAGWQLAGLPLAGGRVTYNSSTYRCPSGDPGTRYRTYQNFQWTDSSGATHFFPISTQSDPNGCVGGSVTSDNEMATDSSGYQMYVTNYNSAIIRGPDGSEVYPSFEDSNGNFGESTGQTPISVTVNGSQTYYDVLNAQGSRSRYTVNTGTISVSTGFGQSGITEQTNYQLTVVTSIQLPDGSSYQMGYDGYGELNSLTLATGGQITYTYTNFQDAYGNVNRWIYSRVTPGGTWLYSPAVYSIASCQAIQSGTIQGCQVVSVVKPSNEVINYYFSLNGGAWNSEADYYNASGTRVAIIQQIFDLNNTCDQCIGAAYIQKQTLYTKLPTAAGQTLTSEAQYTYDGIYDSNITKLQEWNFTTGSPSGNPDRETDTTYTSSIGSYNAVNILNRPTQITRYAGACCSAMLAQTKYSYDSTGLTSMTGIVNHDDTNYGTGNTVRGNVTQVQQWISGSSYWTTTLTYDTTGQLRQSQDNAGNTTSISYGDSYYNDNGANPPASTSPPNGPTNLYPTQITAPIIGTQSLSYFLGTGQLAFSTDQNGATSYSHYADPFSRPTLSTDPIGGWQLSSYSSQTQQDIYTTLNSATPSTSCSSCRHDQIVLDSLGRVTNTILLNDPDGQINANIYYDSIGRVSSSYNPYRSNSDSTYGSTGFNYDGLDRVTQVTRPDGNTVTTAYGNLLSSATSVCGVTAYPSVTTDEAGNQRQYWTDGFGRLLEVDEPDSGGGLSIATCYQYDLLDNLLTVTQEGGTTNQSQWRVRMYQYDGLSRVTQVTTTEAGTETYAYTNSGSPCSGNPSLPCSRTRPMANQSNPSVTTTTTYSYDALNRLTGKSYTDGTASVAYYYDQSSYNGLTISNGKGRRTGMSDGTGETAWTYDAAGNVLVKRQIINGVTNSISYTYNLNSSVATLTSPGGETYTYGYDNALRPVSVADNGIGATYVQYAHYAGPGLLTSAQHGLSLAITESNSFNNRLQPTVLSASAPSETVFSLSYNWTLASGKNNGSVYQIQNNRDNTRSAQYGYDQLNRLTSAQTFNAATWGNTYVYDNWGNLLQKNPISGYEGENLTVTADAHNQLHPTSGSFTYDAAGNMTWDTFNAMSFDAENQETPESSSSYYYDGDGHRVEKVVEGDAQYYWYDDNNNVITSTGAVGQDYVYFNGSKVAFLGLASGNQHYYWSDHLNSAAVMSNSDGSSIEWESDYYPFGTQRPINQYLNNQYMFTGWEWDSGTGYYNAHFRLESPNLGRFMSPDPISSDLTNPQSFNRYAYALNDPSNAFDPLGLFVSCPSGSGPNTVNSDGTTSCGAPPSWFSFAWAGYPGPLTFDQLCAMLGFCGGKPAQSQPSTTNTPKKLTPQQCAAIQTLLQREQQSGTTVAAWRSAIGFGDGTVEPFNSSVPGQAYTNTAAGPVKLDWFTDMRLSTLIPGPQLLAYSAGKLVWTGERLATGAPITNMFPFQDPVEMHTLTLAINGYGFRNLFPPAFMKENCSK